MASDEKRSLLDVILASCECGKCSPCAAREELRALRAKNAAMREALRELLAADEAWWHGQGDPRDGTPLLLRMDDARKRARTALGGSHD